MSAERWNCPCSTCPCSGSTSVAGQPCPLCSMGAHRPPKEVQDHLRRGFEAWQRIVPTTEGSSGLSDRQLRNAAKSWLAWHKKEKCPLDYHPRVIG